MKHLIIGVFLFVPSFALAQSSPPPPPKSDVVQEVQQDFQTLAGVMSALPGSQFHLAKDLEAAMQELTELRAENKRMKADIESKASPERPK